MSRRSIEYLSDFFITQMNHWALFPFIMLVICMTKSFVPCDDPNILLWLLCGLLPFALYVCRMRFQSLFKLVISHILCVAVQIAISFVLCNSFSNKLYFVIIGIGYAVYSLHIRMTKTDFTDSEFLMPVAVGISVVASFMAHYLGFTEWDSYFLIPLIAVFGLYFTGSYLKNYLYFLKVNDSSTGHIPEREIFRTGSFMAFLFSILAMVALFLLSGIKWLNVILAAVREVILSALRFLFSLLPESTESEPLLEETPVSGGGLPDNGPAPEPSLFWNIILWTLTIAIIVCLIYAAYQALKRCIAFIIKAMNHRPNRNVRENEKVLDVRERCAIEKNTSSDKKTGFLQAFTPRDRIRKLYKKHILAAKRLRSLTPGNHEEGDPALLTAREWGILLEKTDMSSIYEKARYSDAACTAEDFRRMKEACK